MTETWKPLEQDSETADAGTAENKLQQKAEAIVAKSSAAKKLRDYASWPGLILLATVLILMAQAVVREVIL